MIMTVEEALKRVKMSIGISPSENIVESHKILSDAIEELLQYRAIGTVEELKTMKENGAFSALEMVQIVARLNRLKEYEEIGTVSELRELKEKATARKPIVIDVFSPKYSCKTYRCPSCNYKLISKIDGSWCGGTRSKCCEECGTALDWSEGKE